MTMQRMFGPRGFTTRPEVWDLVGLVSSDYGNIRYFRAMPADNARQLLALMPNAVADMHPNGTPSLRDFVAMSEIIPGMFFHGYVVTEVREDERVTIEGFYVPKSHKDAALRMAKTYGCEPDEWMRRDIEDAPYWYAWWD